MSDKDFTIGAVVGIPTAGSLNKKPSYLLTLEDSSGKKGACQRFITIDKPDSQNGFLMAKGIFSEMSEEEIMKKFSDALTNAPKEVIVDVWFPWHRVISVKSLVFNANKLTTINK